MYAFKFLGFALFDCLCCGCENRFLDYMCLWFLNYFSIYNLMLCPCVPYFEVFHILLALAVFLGKTDTSKLSHHHSFPWSCIQIIPIMHSHKYKLVISLLLLYVERQFNVPSTVPVSSRQTDLCCSQDLPNYWYVWLAHWQTLASDHYVVGSVPETGTWDGMWSVGQIGRISASILISSLRKITETAWFVPDSEIYCIYVFCYVLCIYKYRHTFASSLKGERKWRIKA